MKISKLYVRHFKGIREIEIYADPNVNEISGPNEAGKSSVLDAIVAAVAGKKAIDPRPLRDGEEKGEILLETDDGLQVIRRFKESGSTTLTIKHADEKKRGQRDLDNLFSDYTFDPLAFTRLAPRDQIKTLQDLAGKEFSEQLAAMDKQIEEVMQDRTLANRELKKIGKLAEVEEVEPVDIGELTGKLKKIEKFNKEQDELSRIAVSLEEDVQSAQAEVERLKEALDESQQDLSTLTSALKQTKQPKPTKQTEDIHQQLAEAGETNRRAQEFKEYQAKLQDFQDKSKESLALDRKVENLRDDRSKLAKSADLPVDGIEFTSSGLLLDGIPFEQLASSQQIRISSLIGMRINNALRIMRIKDGSLLDDDSFGELVTMAKEHDIQLWIESVGQGHGDAIEIEAGEIKKDAF